MTELTIDVASDRDKKSNPLLEGYAEPLAYSAFGRRLVSMPLEKVEWRSIPPENREWLLDNPTEHYVPVRTVFDPACGLQTLIRRSLALINPLIPENQRRVNAVALCARPEDLLGVGSVDGAGGLWDGIAGTGRTQLAMRVLRLLVPDQVRVYGPSRVCGWTRMIQAVWLAVDHPSNGTRTGILKRILVALDRALGTSYFDDNRRTTNIDTLLVEVCSKLALHRVALLLIDENHEDNLANSPWHHEFVLFYQSAMNLGVSILLIGNPLAFTNLKAYGQPLRRLMVGGIHHFEPAASVDEMWWCFDYVPRMRLFNVVEECAIEPKLRLQLEFDFTGGVHGLYPLLNVQSQRIALRRGGKQAVLKEADLRAAANSPFFREARSFAECVRGVESVDTLRFLDVPDSAIASRKKSSPPGAPTPPDVTIPNVTGAAYEVVKKLVTRFKSQQTRAANKFMKKIQVLAKLTPEERAMLGISDELEEAANAERDAQEAAAEQAAARKAAAAARRATAKKAGKETTGAGGSKK